MTNIFEKRVNILPYDYPELMDFVDAIQDSYWVHKEFKGQIPADIQDFKVLSTPVEKSIMQKTMLAISQIEFDVKVFWSSIYKRMPKPEIAMVGSVFSECEVRHALAYKFLLEKMGLASEFEKIFEIPAIIDRVKYLNKYKEGARSRDDRKYILSVLLFSVFIEHVSLFSQFFIMMSFNKHQAGRFKGISNIIEATSKEEDIHGQFGLKLVEIVKRENPEWFNAKLYDEVRKACIKAQKAEQKMLDWIFEAGELPFLTKEKVIAFQNDRFNRSMINLGIDPLFEVDKDHKEDFEWFYEEMLSTKDNDFFNKRSTAYSKNNSVTADDLF